MNNNKKTTNGRNHKFINRQILLGTSIVPKFGTDLYQERVNLNNKSVQDYISNESQKTRKPVELRIAYISFDRTERENGESAREHYERDLLLHNEIVNQTNAKFQDCWIKEDFKNTSIKTLA